MLEPSDADVLVRGVGEGDIITLRGNSEVSWTGNSPFSVSLSKLEAEGNLEARVIGNVNGKSKATVLELSNATLSSEGSLAIASGSRQQQRRLRVAQEQDYYLIPVGVVRAFLEQNVAGHSDIIDTSVSSVISGAANGKFPRTLEDPSGQFTTYQLKEQLRGLSESVYPFWRRPNEFVLLQSPIVPPFGFKKIKDAHVDLEGKINLRIKGPFLLNGEEYSRGKITGAGKAYMAGTLERLSLIPPLIVASDFARITGDLYLERTDGIIKNWETSVQLSPAELELAAMANAARNPKYFKALAIVTGLGFFCVASYAGFFLHFGLFLRAGTLLPFSVATIPLVLFGRELLRLQHEDRTVLREASVLSSYNGSLYEGYINRLNPRN